MIEDLRTGRRSRVPAHPSAATDGACFAPSGLALAGARAYWEEGCGGQTVTYGDLVSSSLSDRALRHLGTEELDYPPDNFQPPVSDGRSVYFWFSTEIVRFHGLKRERFGGAVAPPSALAAGGGRFARANIRFQDAAAPAWSPDGTKIAYVTHGGLWLVNADGTDEHKIVSHGDEPDWSPDSTKLAYTSAGKVVIANADGSNPQVITSGSDPAWSPDGQELAVTYKGGIWIVSTDGQNRRRVIAKGSQPDWSPDGSRLVFTGPDPDYELMVANADGSDPRSLHVPNVDSPTWSPDGTEIAFTGCTLCGSGFDVVNVWEIRPDGSGKRTLHTGGDGFNWAYDPSWGPKPGQLVYVYAPAVMNPGDGLGQLWTWPGNQRLTTDPPPVVRISSGSGRTTAPINAGGPLLALAVSNRVAAALVHEPGGWAVEIYQPHPRTVPLPGPPRPNLSASGTTLVFQVGHTIETLNALHGSPQAVARTRGNTAIGLSIFGRRIAWADRGRIRTLDLPR